MDYNRYMNKTTTTFNSEELRLISDLFATVASLDLYDDSDNEQDSDPDLFNKTWDKVTSLSDTSPVVFDA
jgi:hypothetical protein